MSNAEKTLVTVATYNEMENLPQLVDEVFQVAPQVHLLVVDDDSPDGTGQWCERKGAEDPRLHCLHRQGKLGLGTAIIAGMRYAIQQGYKITPLTTNTTSTRRFLRRRSLVSLLVTGLSSP